MNYVLPANICVINSMAYFLKLIQMSIKKFIENEKKNKSVLAYVNVYIWSFYPGPRYFQKIS